MRKLKYIILSFIMFLPCAFFFGCGEKAEETAICKIDGVKYDSLAKAIDFSVDGDTIKVYNDCIETAETLSELGVTFKLVGEKIYAQYKIEKQIYIEGVGIDKPVVQGSFSLELNDKYTSYDKITISGLEIKHSGMEHDADFNYGILVLDGSVNVRNSYIHYAGEEIDKNGNGVVITRKNGSYEHSQNARKLSYNISGNQFGDYKGRVGENLGSAVTVFSGGEKYGTMSENQFNYSIEALEKTIFKDNKFGNGNLVYQYDFSTKKVMGLVTDIKANIHTQIADAGVLIFNGNLVYSLQEDINLYCETIIKGHVKNVNFFAKTMKAKVQYEKNGSANVTFKPITEI